MSNDILDIVFKSIDSKQEFNKRIGADNLREGVIELESRILKAEARIAQVEAKARERFDYIEKVIGLYRENIAILDGEIERVKKMKFKPVKWDD